jgi:hypothetical protein
MDGLAASASVPHAIQLAALPDHPAVRYAGLETVGDMAMAAGAGGGSSGGSVGVAAVSDDMLRDLLGFSAADSTP